MPRAGSYVYVADYGFETVLDEDDLERKNAEVEFDDNPISESPKTSDQVQGDDA